MEIAIWVVKPEGYKHSEVFSDVACVLREGFIDKGHHSVIVFDKDPPLAKNIIILGANLIPFLSPGTMIPESAVIYNLEQISPESDWISEDYLNILRNNRVIDYSGLNKAELKKLGVECDIVPICYHEVLSRIEPLPEEEKDIDVLFYGSLNRRRVGVLSEIGDHGLTVSTRMGVYGVERDDLIRRAKCVLNVHYYESKVLEMVRLSYLLANKVFVVSELGIDLNESEPFSKGILFADRNQLAGAVKSWIELGVGHRDAVANEGFEVMKKTPISDHIEAFLEMF